MITLVLLPGMDGTGQLFDPFIAALGGEFHVKAVRYPATEPMGYAELESWARAALPTDGPFMLLGESFSGPIAISLAASAPPQLKGLVLCCTFARNPQPLFTVLRSFVPFLPLTAMPVGLLDRFLLGRFSTAGLRSAFAQALAQVSPDALRARLRSVLAVDVSAQLRAIKVPTLYLRAASDRVVPRAASRRILRLKPDTHVVQIEAPHFLLQAAPAEAACVVGGFMRATAGRGTPSET
jgi:pimeloyl-ACP methyl ester carboxylesterase